MNLCLVVTKFKKLTSHGLGRHSQLGQPSILDFIPYSQCLRHVTHELVVLDFTVVSVLLVVLILEKFLDVVLVVLDVLVVIVLGPTLLDGVDVTLGPLDVF